ncbi:flagellar biosynthesis anti-sigma factor FlgM [Corynebacterium propinquum]|uniref:flagellar biosynthesis anti-sigma factor FlgM n=1 Tax=Corynebacterium propinquum TaxID=43769 RepID=UPI00254B63BD|nr:flagellar biosynthesis anti-sigma factor FlgM [Corynebacterium propinquum]MDK8666222.1 flagellar biosynthesis anti-sigma factor FlgM [Corynebacterium propinquum]
MTQTGIRAREGREEQESVAVLADVRAERVASLRNKIAGLESAANLTPVQQKPRLLSNDSVSEGNESSVDPYRVVELSGQLAGVIPIGGLPKNSVSHCSDCPALVSELIAQISAQGKTVAIVNWSDLSLAQVAESGDLSKIITVPNPGGEWITVLGVLAEGVDVLIYRSPRTHTLSPTQARPLLAKIRKGRAAVLTVGAQVPSPALTINAQVTGFSGIGCGTGRIRNAEIAVSSYSKTHRNRPVVLTCGVRSSAVASSSVPSAAVSGSPEPLQAVQ